MTKKQYKEEKSLAKRRSLGAASLAKWLLGGALFLSLVLVVLLFSYLPR